MKLGGGNDFGQLLHIDGLDIEDICKSVVSFHNSFRWQSHGLKLWSLMFKFHRLIRRSSADMYVSPSLLILIEFIW